MTGPTATKLWTPAGATTATYGIRKLMKDGLHDTAVAFLVAEVANRRFGGIVSAFAELSPIKESGIRLLFSEPISDSWTVKYMYEVSGLNVRLYPWFATCVDITREIALEHKGGFSDKLRDVIVEKTLAAPPVRELKLSPKLITHFRYFVGQPAPPEAMPATSAPPAPAIP
jgi:hypothetical protein